MVKRILVTAHTGCLGTEDNSVASFLAGVFSGADIIEVDVRFSEQGIPVLSHDPVSYGTDHSLVRLSAILKLMEHYPHIMVNLDMKEKHGLRHIGKMIDEAGVRQRVFFTGIEAEATEMVRTECPGINYLLAVQPDPLRMNEAKYLSSIVDEVKSYGAVGINLYHRLVTTNLVCALHAANKAVVSGKYFWINFGR